MPSFKSLVGAAKMKATVRNIRTKYPDFVARAIYTEAQIEMTEMKRRTPVDTDTLRSSGFVEEPVRTPRKIYVVLGFGGAAKAYAIYVHEDLEAFHKVGQAKFAESVLQESAPHMAQRIATRVHLDKVKNL